MSDTDIPDSHDSIPGFPAPSEAAIVFGHDDQSRFLATAYRSGRMHHALLFDGAPGIGKASLAFLFARHIIANPDWSSAPDHIDASSGRDIAHQIAMGSHAQVLYLTRPVDQKSGKHKTQLTIDETRRISHFLSRTVAGNGRRIVIVDPVNDMNANAANALLKNLEEPTPRTLFILIAHSSGRLLPTIRSRCLQLRFSPLSDDEMRATLNHLGVTQKLGAAQIDRLILQSEGSPRIAAMLSEGGGLDILDAAHKVISGPLFDASGALKVGEALSTRDGEPLYLLLTGHLLALTARLASAAAQTDSFQAASLASIHAALSAKISEGLRFNLDRRQTLCEVLQSLHAAAAGRMPG
jgi:DNA polymerase III subunit delta'